MLALHGGEDYELLFTVPKRFSRRLPLKIEGLSVTVIGEITRGKKIVLQGPGGNSGLLQALGWDPFRKID